MKKLKVLLAGSTGFIGKVLLFELSQRNFEIYCPVREISSENLYLNKKKITEIEVDITKKESVEVLQRQCGKLDLIISCASSLDLNTLKNFEHFLLNEGGFIYDINYSNDTNFKLKDLSLSKNANFYNGVGMLVEQAAECFRLWFDKKPSVEEVKNLLNERV